MTDGVQIALITAGPSVLTALLGVALFFRQGVTQKTVQDVKGNVDGNLTSIRDELKELNDQLQKSNRALGQAEGRETGRTEESDRTP